MNGRELGVNIYSGQAIFKFWQISRTKVCRYFFLFNRYIHTYQCLYWYVLGSRERNVVKIVCCPIWSNAFCHLSGSDMIPVDRVPNNLLNTRIPSTIQFAIVSRCVIDKLQSIYLHYLHIIIEDIVRVELVTSCRGLSYHHEWRCNNNQQAGNFTCHTISTIACVFLKAIGNLT